MKKIAVIVGSLRKASWNRKIALELMALAPSTLQMELIEIGKLPLYNQDLDDENHPPKEWTEFREHMAHKDGVLFATPEYNRTIPSPLKNAIDVGSRPYGKSIWGGKAGAVISVSPGAIGGFGANQHLRQSFVFLDIFPLQQPEAYISGVDKLFDANGQLKEETKKFLKTFIDAYAAWVQKILK
jgi:chromate reductase